MTLISSSSVLWVRLSGLAETRLNASAERPFHQRTLPSSSRTVYREVSVELLVDGGMYNWDQEPSHPCRGGAGIDKV